MYGCVTTPLKANSVYPIGINSNSPVVCFKQYLSSALKEYSNTNLKAIFTVLTPHTWWMNSCLPQVFSSTAPPKTNFLGMILSAKSDEA